MKTKIIDILLVFFFLPAALGAQEVLEIHGDTLIVLNSHQLGLVNSIIAEREGLVEEVQVLDSLVTSQDSLRSVLEQKIETQEQIERAKSNIIKIQNSEIELAKKEIKKEKRKKWLWSVMSFASAFVLGYLVN